MDAGAIAAGLSAATAQSRWRMEVTERPDGVIVVNDAYNASPEAVDRRAGRTRRHSRGTGVPMLCSAGWPSSATGRGNSMSRQA